MKKLFATLILLVVFVPAFGLAASFKTGDTSATIEKTEHFKNLYVASQTVNIDGNISKDLTAAGNSVNVNGNVESDFNAAANSIVVNGTVGNTIHAAGRDLVVRGNVGGDIFAAGQNVVIEKNSTVMGDFLVAGDVIEINGKILGNVKVAGASTLIIRGTVEGSVDAMSVKKLTIENGAIIVGKLTYRSANLANIANEKNIKGGIEYKELKSPDFKLNFTEIAYWSLVVKSIVILVTLLIAVYLMPRLARNFVNETYKKVWPNLGWGAFTLFVIPVIGILFFVTFVGIPIAVILGLLYLLAVITAGVATSLIVGSLAIKLYDRKAKEYLADWKAVLIGVAITFILSLIPIVGPLVLFVFFLFALGEVSLTLWGAFRKQKA